MRTSATPPRSETGRGFTLLELVVVLALLGLAVALVAPAGFRTIETWRRATEVDGVLERLSGLPETARQEGKALTFPAGPLPAEQLGDLPEGWVVRLDDPLVIHPNGACLGSRGALVNGGYSRAFRMDAPFCRAVLDGEAP